MGPQGPQQQGQPRPQGPQQQGQPRPQGPQQQGQPRPQGPVMNGPRPSGPPNRQSSKPQQDDEKKGVTFEDEVQKKSGNGPLIEFSKTSRTGAGKPMLASLH